MSDNLMNDAKKVPLPADFFEYPIWRYDDEDDLYHPVRSKDELPESERVLSIRARFSTPNGESFDGYVVGIERIFSIGLFGDGRIFHVNRNLPDLSRKQVDAFINSQPQLATKTVESLFPLEYATMMKMEHFADFKGRFEALEKKQK